MVGPAAVSDSILNRHVRPLAPGGARLLRSGSPVTVASPIASGQGQEKAVL